jgi:hypothetical protein
MSTGLLIDANLLVLFTIGSVNRNRIRTFKRTSRYTEADYELLVRVMARFEPVGTVAHVPSEVSNLTDLDGPERRLARDLLKDTIAVLIEPEITSKRATADPVYRALGLADAAIGAVARAEGWTVLTDDLDLYLFLIRDNLSVLNFAHLQAASWE